MSVPQSRHSSRHTTELERAAVRMLEQHSPAPITLTHPELLKWLARRVERSRRNPSMRLLWWDGELVDLAQAFGRADDLGLDAQVVLSGDELFRAKDAPSGA